MEIPKLFHFIHSFGHIHKAIVICTYCSYSGLPLNCIVQVYLFVHITCKGPRLALNFFFKSCAQVFHSKNWIWYYIKQIIYLCSSFLNLITIYSIPCVLHLIPFSNAFNLIYATWTQLQVCWKRLQASIPELWRNVSSALKGKRLPLSSFPLHYAWIPFLWVGPSRKAPGMWLTRLMFCKSAQDSTSHGHARQFSFVHFLRTSGNAAGSLDNLHILGY